MSDVVPRGPVTSRAIAAASPAGSDPVSVSPEPVAWSRHASNSPALD